MQQKAPKERKIEPAILNAMMDKSYLALPDMYLDHIDRIGVKSPLELLPDPFYFLSCRHNLLRLVDAVGILRLPAF
jgi:hypothetical protein